MILYHLFSCISRAYNESFVNEYLLERFKLFTADFLV